MITLICIILDNYNVARLKTKKAEYTSASDLNSEIENQTKRKRIKNRLYESDSDECDQNNSSLTKQKQLKGFSKQIFL